MRELLETTLWREIPLTRSLGLRVESASARLVRLAFPLEPNINHKQTAFGGSLYNAAVLAGWSLAWLALKEQNLAAHVVIVAGDERFLKPVKGDFVAECAAAPEALEQAFRVLRRKGKARLALEGVVLCRSEVCLAFRGSYGLVGA